MTSGLLLHLARFSGLLHCTCPMALNDMHSLHVFHETYVLCSSGVDSHQACLAEGIPNGIKQATFLLQRQSKLQSSDLADVEGGTATWTHVLKQVGLRPFKRSANMLLPPAACCRVALLEAVQLARWMMRGVSCQSLATGSAARSSTRPRERRRV